MFQREGWPSLWTLFSHLTQLVSKSRTGVRTRFINPDRLPASCYIDRCLRCFCWQEWRTADIGFTPPSRNTDTEPLTVSCQVWIRYAFIQSSSQDLNFGKAIHSLGGTVQESILTKLWKGGGAEWRWPAYIFCKFSSVCVITLLNRILFWGGPIAGWVPP